MEMPMTESMYYILISVLEPIHGYGIMQLVESMTRGRVTLVAGTLYGAIRAMLDKGWIRLYSQDDGSRRKKEYIATAAGRKVLQLELARLGEQLDNGKKALARI